MNTQIPNKFLTQHNTVMALNNMIQPNFAMQNIQKVGPNQMVNNLNLMGMALTPMNYQNNMQMPIMNPMINPMMNQMNQQFNQNQMLNSKLYYNHCNYVFKDYYRNLNNEKKFVMQAEF